MKLEIPTRLLLRLALGCFQRFAAGGFHPRLAAPAQAHHLLLLGLGHVEPVEALFAAAQTPLAVALVVHFTDPDAGALQREDLELFHPWPLTPCYLVITQKIPFGEIRRRRLEGVCFPPANLASSPPNMTLGVI